LLIFVFAGVSCGRIGAILAEFAPVPNAPSDVDSASASAAASIAAAARAPQGRTDAKPPAPAEFGGPTGPEPTRFGDWEKNGRCIDF
jgi:hypothetical protein